MINESDRAGATGVLDSVEFRLSGIHGMGGYARRDIGEGDEIIEYVGERITKEESNRRCELNNPYIFGLDETHDLDGDVEWNPARFINHSCEPNCEAIEDEGRIWIVALRDIRAGEELTFNYGYSLEEYQDNPCRCGANGCVGFMVAEEYHETVRRKVAMRVDAGSPGPMAAAERRAETAASLTSFLSMDGPVNKGHV